MNTGEKAMEGFITEADAAKMLDLTIHGLQARRWRKSTCAIPFYKMGRKVYYKRQEILDYIESRRIEIKK